MSANINVIAVRAFCLAGERVEPGSVVELSAALAGELIARGVASKVVSPAIDEAPPKSARRRKSEGPAE